MKPLYTSIIASAILAGSLANCFQYVKPSPASRDNPREYIRTELTHRLQEEGECDRASLTQMNRNGVTENILTCDEEKDGKYTPKWGINLDYICNVTIKEKHFPPLVKYLWNDDVIIDTSSGETYSITVNDTLAKELGEMLKADLNQRQPEVQKCPE